MQKEVIFDIIQDINIIYLDILYNYLSDKHLEDSYGKAQKQHNRI